MIDFDSGAAFRPDSEVFRPRTFSLSRNIRTRVDTSDMSEPISPPKLRHTQESLIFVGARTILLSKLSYWADSIGDIGNVIAGYLS